MHRIFIVHKITVVIIPSLIWFIFMYIITGKTGGFGMYSLKCFGLLILAVLAFMVSGGIIASAVIHYQGLLGLAALLKGMEGVMYGALLGALVGVWVIIKGNSEILSRLLKVLAVLVVLQTIAIILIKSI